MRKLINIWKIPWNSPWMQRAVHICHWSGSVQLCMWFPKEGTRSAGTAGGVAQGQCPAQLPALGVQRLSWDAGSQFASSQLHFGFCFPVVLDNQAQRGGMDRSKCSKNCPLWSLEEDREDTAQPSRQPQTGRGAWKSSRAGQPLRGTQRNLQKPHRTRAKCCPFPSSSCWGATARSPCCSEEHSAAHTAPPCSHSILTPAHTWQGGACRDEMDFNRPI